MFFRIGALCYDFGDSMDNLVTPCIGICGTYNGVCVGCNRTSEQIRKWDQYTQEEKDEIITDPRFKLNARQERPLT